MVIVTSSTYFSYFLLESKCELRAPKLERALSLRYHGQPLDQQRDGNVEGEVTNDMEVRRL